MKNEEILRAALVGYQLQLDSIQHKMAELENELGMTTTLRKGRKPSAKPAKKKPAKHAHKMSQAGRDAIAKAQRLRWKKAKAAVRAKRRQNVAA